jgi:hypothetical protein
MDPIHDRVEELTKQMIERVQKAELALNRHGFTQDERGDWKAPGMPNWAGALELRDYLAMHFPDIAKQSGSLSQKATRALMESEQRRNDAAIEWIRSSLPSLQLRTLHLIAAPEEAREAIANIEAQLEGRTMERDALHQHIRQAAAQTPATAPPKADSPELPAAPPIFKAIWPDPKTMNFTLNDRRDPFNLAERHTELRRRSTDLDED